MYGSATTNRRLVTIIRSTDYTGGNTSSTTRAWNTTTGFQGFAMPTEALWAPDPDPALELARLARHRLGRRLDAGTLRDRWRRWTRAAKTVGAYLRQLEERDEAARRLARHMRPREPKRRPPRARARTCSSGSARAARPPEALS